MKTFDDYCKSMTREQFMEIASAVKYKTIPEREIIKRYNVTSWFINNLKQRLNFVTSTRDDEIYRDYCSGNYSIFDLCNKYSIKESRLNNIINNHRGVDVKSKELF